MVTRIGLVCHRYPPYTGGLERHVFDVAQGLVSRGFHVKVFSTSSNERRSGGESMVEMRAIQLPAGGYYFWPGFLSPPVLRELHEIDVLHSFSATMFPPIAALSWARLKRVPSVLTATYHPVEFTPHVFPRYLYDHLVMGHVVRGYDRIILQSEVETTSLMQTIGNLRSARIKKIEHSSGILRVKPEALDLRDRIGRPGVHMILCVGRVDYFKGFDDVVKACAILRRRGLDMIVVHAGPREGWFRGTSLIETSSQDLVLPLGPVSERSLASAYLECDVTVIPSRFESFGLVSIESLLMGTPVVSTPTGIMPELISDGVNGSLYEPGQTEMLANKIEGILRSQSATGRNEKSPLISVDKYGKPEREIDDIVGVYSELT